MSIPPPGWTPAPAVATAGAPSHALEALRTESRRHLDGRRLWARMVDWLIVAPFSAAAIWAWGWHLGTYALSQCLLLILHHVCEVTAGATPGKRLLGLRVARLEDGELPTPRQAAARGVIGIFEMGLVAGLAIICTKGRRRLGDLAAGTAVVDARRHPVASRPLFRGAVAYPVVWAIPAVVACVLGARGDVPGSYRQRADAICAQASAQAPRAFAAAGLPGVISVADTQQIRLASLTVPYAWKARHAELLRRLGGQEALLRGATMRIRASAHPGREAAAVQRQLAAMTRDDQRALSALGYHACAA